MDTKWVIIFFVNKNNIGFHDNGNNTEDSAVKVTDYWIGYLFNLNYRFILYSNGHLKC